jgi:hypothetical protein
MANYQYTEAKRVDIGNPTKKQDFDELAESADALLEYLATVDELILSSGGVSCFYNSTGYISQVVAINPDVTINYTYNSTGYLTQVQALFTSPANATVTIIYSYNSTGQITSVNRTVQGLNKYVFSHDVLLYAQHLGDDSYTLPDGLTTTDYVLLRRPLPEDAEGSLDYETVDLTASFGGSGNTTLLLDRRFYLAEDWPDFVVQGVCLTKATIAAKGDGSNATRITQVKFDLETVNNLGTYTTLDSASLSFSTPFSVSSTSYNDTEVEALLEVSTTNLSTTKEDLVFRVQIYGNMATGGSANSIRLYFTRGQADTWVEVPMAKL